MGVRVVFLLNCPLVLFILKHKDVRTFLNKKYKDSKLRNPLNSSIDKNKIKSKDILLLIFKLLYPRYVILMRKCVNFRTKFKYNTLGVVP